MKYVCVCPPRSLACSWHHRCLLPDHPLARERTKGVDCEQPGATTRTLPIEQGYWRASVDSTVIRQCFNEVRCVPKYVLRMCGRRPRRELRCLLVSLVGEEEDESDLVLFDQRRKGSLAFSPLLTLRPSMSWSHRERPSRGVKDTM